MTPSKKCGLAECKRFVRYNRHGQRVYCCRAHYLEQNRRNSRAWYRREVKYPDDRYRDLPLAEQRAAVQRSMRARQARANELQVRYRQIRSRASQARREADAANAWAR